MTKKWSLFPVFREAVAQGHIPLRSRQDFDVFMQQQRDFEPSGFESSPNNPPNRHVLRELGMNAEEFTAYKEAYARTLLDVVRQFSDAAQQPNLLTPEDREIIGRRLLVLSAYRFNLDTAMKQEAIETLFPHLHDLEKHAAAVGIVETLIYIDPEAPVPSIIARALQEKERSTGMPAPQTVGAFFLADQKIWGVDVLFGDVFNRPGIAALINQKYQQDQQPWDRSLSHG
jgi:hypothetical protein